MVTNTSFKRRPDPKQALGLGRPFGFTLDLKDLEFNDGIKNLYISNELAKKIVDIPLNYKYGFYWLKKDIDDFYFKGIKYGHRGKKFYDKEKDEYKGMYTGTVRILKRSSSNQDFFQIAFMSGSHGFGGIQHTKKETLGKWSKMAVLEQIYKRLENYYYGI
jgi:hypothetical protein